MWDIEEIDIDLICDLVLLALSVFGSFSGPNGVRGASVCLNGTQMLFRSLRAGEHQDIELH